MTGAGKEKRSCALSFMLDGSIGRGASNAALSHDDDDGWELSVLGCSRSAWVTFSLGPPMSSLI